MLIYGVREFEALNISVGIGGRVHGHLLHSSHETENQSFAPKFEGQREELQLTLNYEA